MNKTNLGRSAFLALLLMISGFFATVSADETTPKITPEIEVQNSSDPSGNWIAYIGQQSFATPTITIKVNGSTALTYRFKKTFSIEGGTLGKDKDGKDISTDAVTGSYVMTRYGSVFIGKKSGTFKVNVKIEPTDAYVKLYESATVSYTVQIPAVTPVVKTETQDGATIAYSTGENGNQLVQTIPQPIFQLIYGDGGSDVDVIDRYDMTAKPSDNAPFTVNADGSITAIYGVDDNSTGTITYSFEPKAEYVGSYTAVEKTITFKVKQIIKGETVHVTASFIPSAKQKTIEDKDGNKVTYPQFSYCGQWGGEAFVPLKYVIKDAFGNDVTSRYGYPEFEVINHYAGDESETKVPTYVWGPNNAMSGTKGYAEIHYKLKSITGVYEPVEISYNHLIIPRVPTPKITPDPNTIEITAGTAIDYTNRFNVVGEFYDENKEEWTYLHYDSNDANKMSYTFAFEKKLADDGIIVVENFPHLEQHYKEIEDENGVVWCQYTTTKDFGTDQNWTIKFTKTGSYDFKYVVNPWNYNYWAQGSAIMPVTYVVSDKIKGYMKIVPNEIVVYSDDKDFKEPDATVVDVFDDDITENYDLTYTIIVDGEPLTPDPKTGLIKDPTTGTTINPTTGKVTLGKDAEGDIVVKVIATPKGGEDSKYVGCEGKYTIHLKQPAGTDNSKWYEIIKTKKSNNGVEGEVTELSYTDQEMGKLHFIGLRETIAPGYTIKGGIPGLDVTFGKVGGQEADIKMQQEDESNPNREEFGSSDVVGKPKFFMLGAAAQADEREFPTGGLFYKLMPYTNGYLTVDAKWTEGHEHILIAENNGTIWKESFKPTTDTKGEHRFRFALIAGTTYYLYDADGSSLHVHGISYDPAYIMNRVTYENLDEATAFLNGYSGTTPKLLYSPSENVTFSSSDPSYAEIDARSGILTPKKATTADSNVRISGKVQSNYDIDIFKMPSYKLYISELPSFWVEDGLMYGVGQTVSTTNIKTNINMTFGGWLANEMRPYIKGGKETDLLDEWNIAKMDSAGQRNRTIDGFRFATSGKQNPLDENGASFSFGTTTSQAYKVPCRGTYAKFEPEESGMLIVYLIQNGICQYNGDPSTKPVERKKIKWNPVFIMDEAGKDVELLPNESWEGINLPTKEGTYSQYTEGIYRCSIDDENIAAAGGWDWNTEFLKEGNGTAADKTAIEQMWREDWNNNKDSEGGKNIAHGLKVYKTEKGGYVTVSKAYTRYALHVKSGKTYFISQNGSKLYLCGFSFVPDGYGAGYKAEENAPTEEIALNDNKTPREAETNTEKEFVNVTLNRTFKKDQWAALCLPFSVNETQFKRLFGDDAMIITFDSLMSNAAAHYTQHAYHMIEAGRPYFVKPSIDVALTSTEDGNTQAAEATPLKFERVTIEGVEPIEIVGNGPESPYIYTFVGNYSPTTMPAYSYYMGNDNNLHRQTKPVSIKGYRSYLTPPADDNGVAMIQGLTIANGGDDEDGGTTGIINIVEDATTAIGTHINNTGVVNMNGQTVRRSADTKGLPKGLYIVNGKKVIIK